ncbi:autotransporter family protein [Pontiella sulfatireligans]|uniref:Outer membrane protein B n=1 Tax=Pontiella sulfatireligans TaxID=2750658 RepID=A0A6C2UM60_9BACT|nr:autotransporter domain-containing protein [Pontiella sulfatireligans]VGO21345.1 Outer membrane protein B [Pontiella sulfatireligans]
MMKMHLNRLWTVKGENKAKHLLGLAFFLCALTALPVRASTNSATGTAYGTDPANWDNVISISSKSNGPGSLIIGDEVTTSLTLDNAIRGSITITNGFSNFDIIATGASVSNTAGAVLFVAGGTNLAITGGTFRGASGSGGYVLPPLPGENIITNSTSSAAIGAYFSGTKKVVVSKAAFSGGAYMLDDGTSQGTDGIQALNVSNFVFTADSGGSTLTGGSAKAVSYTDGDALSTGGRGLFASGTTLTVSNGTFKGGSAGNAVSASSYSAVSRGGDAVAATGSTISIFKGSFTGGSAGSATNSGSGTAAALGGAGLRATASDVNIYGGSFKGGNAGDAADDSRGGAGLYVVGSTVSIGGGSNAPSFTGGANGVGMLAIDSGLDIDGGTFTGGAYGSGKQFGLATVANAGGTNVIDISAGTFSSINFSGSGLQNFTAGSNLTVNGYVVQDGGTVVVDHLSDAPFQQTLVRSGSMEFANAFTLADGGLFTLDSASSRASFSDINVESGGSLNIGQGELTASGAFGLETGGQLSVSVVNLENGTLYADTATFQTNSSLYIDSTQAGFAGGSTTAVTVVSTDSGILVADAGGATNNATDGNISENVLLGSDTAGRTSLTGLSIDGDNLKAEFATETLREYWNADGQMGTLADDLDAINNTNMMAIIDSIDNPEESKKATEQTYFTTPNTFQTSLLGLQTAMGQAAARGTEFREQLKLIPPGVKGPERNNEIRAWAKYYGNFVNHDSDGLNDGYDTTLHGGTFGADKSFGHLLVGISGGAGKYTTTSDHHDAKEDINAYHGAVYGTYDFSRAYIDAGIAYGFNDVSTKTRKPFVMHGDFDAQLICTYIGGGYDLIDTEHGTVFTPEASLQYTYYEQDSYNERSNDAVPRRIDDYDADSLRSSLGLNISMLNSLELKHYGFKIDGRLHWIHEFNSDTDDMSFKLEGGNANYQLSPPDLDEDLFRAGIGFSFFNTEKQKPKNVLFRVDFDELFGENFNSHNLTLKVVYAF